MGSGHSCAISHAVGSSGSSSSISPSPNHTLLCAGPGRAIPGLTACCVHPLRWCRRYRYIHAPCLSFPTHKEGPRFVLCTFPALILLWFHVSSEVMTPSWGTHGAHTHCVCVVIPVQRHCLSPRGGFESSGRTPERTGEGRNVQRAEICGEVE